MKTPKSAGVATFLAITISFVILALLSTTGDHGSSDTIQGGRKLLNQDSIESFTSPPAGINTNATATPSSSAPSSIAPTSLPTAQNNFRLNFLFNRKSGTSRIRTYDGSNGSILANRGDASVPFRIGSDDGFIEYTLLREVPCTNTDIDENVCYTLQNHWWNQQYWIETSDGNVGLAQLVDGDEVAPDIWRFVKTTCGPCDEPCAFIQNSRTGHFLRTLRGGYLGFSKDDRAIVAVDNLDEQDDNFKWWFILGAYIPPTN